MELIATYCVYAHALVRNLRGSLRLVPGGEVRIFRAGETLYFTTPSYPVLRVLTGIRVWGESVEFSTRGDHSEEWKVWAVMDDRELLMACARQEALRIQEESARAWEAALEAVRHEHYEPA